MLLKFHILSLHTIAIFLLFGFGNHSIFGEGDVASVVSTERRRHRSANETQYPDHDG